LDNLEEVDNLRNAELKELREAHSRCSELKFNYENKISKSEEQIRYEKTFTFYNIISF